MARRRARATGRGCCCASPALVEERLEELAVLEARNAGKPIGDARGEIGMVVETFRYYAGGAGALLGDTIPVAGGIGVHGPRAARRRRADHAVELPADDRGVEARAGAGGGQHRRAQAGRADAADRAALRAASRSRRGSRRASSTSSSGPGRTCGTRLVEHPDVAKIAFTGSTEVGRVDRRRRGADDQARDARARRQVGERRLRRRRPRGGGGGRAAGGVRQRRPGLLRALADPRRAPGAGRFMDALRGGGRRADASATRSTRPPRWAR